MTLTVILKFRRTLYSKGFAGHKKSPEIFGARIIA